MSKTKGRVTLPSESNFLDETKELLERWGADAIRDSDGTKLDRDIKSLDAKIYTTYFVARGHNEFAREHMDECQQLYLMSKRHTAAGTRLGIDFMDGYGQDHGAGAASWGMGPVHGGKSVCARRPGRGRREADSGNPTC